MNAPKEAVIGIDCGGTNTELALVDAEGNIMAHQHLSTNAHTSFDQFAEAVARAIKKLGKGMELCGVGIGAPNGNFFHGTIDRAPNLPWTGVLPFAERIQQHTGVHTVLTNDANAAAIGEQYFGKARGLKNFIVVTIGTGLGSGIVVNGEMLYGHSGFAGEMGHTTVRPGGRLCTCGKHGCLEAYVSARGLVANAAELMEAGELDSQFKTEADLHPPIRLCEAGKLGDELAVAAFRVTGEYLGEHLADMAALFSPEAFFLFGGLTKAGNLLLEPTRQALDAHLLPILQGSVRVELSDLQESNAGILGAAALAWNETQP